MPRRSPISRRSFLETSVATAAVSVVARPTLGGPGFVPPSDKINVGYVGSGTQGIRNLMDALKRDYPDVHGLFVGGCKAGSRYQLELETLAEKMGLSDRMTFTGDRLDIRDWMSASELAFNLSNDPPEAFGRTVLETLCLGRPMIAWNHGGAAEILAEMFPRGAVEPLDFAALEQKTRRFLDAPPRVEKSDAFTLEESMNKHLDVYRTLIGSRNS